MTDAEIIQATETEIAQAVGEAVTENLNRHFAEPSPAKENAARLRWLVSMLEAYRAAQDGTPERRLVDWLIQSSRAAAGRRPQEKRLHNLLVLRYIVDPRPRQDRIIDALGLETRHKYREAERAALERLAVLAFGIDGIQWKE